MYDWMGASVWRVGRTVDDVWNIHQVSKVRKWINERVRRLRVRANVSLGFVSVKVRVVTSTHDNNG